MLESLYRFAGKDSIQDGYKSPDQSPFPGLHEASKEFGPLLIGAHGRQDSSSLQTGVCVCVCVCAHSSLEICDR